MEKVASVFWTSTTPPTMPPLASRPEVENPAPKVNVFSPVLSKKRRPLDLRLVVVQTVLPIVLLMFIWRSRRFKLTKNKIRVFQLAAPAPVEFPPEEEPVVPTEPVDATDPATGFDVADAAAVEGVAAANEDGVDVDPIAERQESVDEATSWNFSSPAMKPT